MNNKFIKTIQDTKTSIYYFFKDRFTNNFIYQSKNVKCRTINNRYYSFRLIKRRYK